MRQVKTPQLDEATVGLESATKARELAQLKQAFYASREFMNVGESAALALSVEAAKLSTAIQLSSAQAATVRVTMPQYTSGGAGFGGSPVATLTEGGQTFADAENDGGQVLTVIAAAMEKAASIAATLAGYRRRQDDWGFQRDQAALEIEQADQAIAAARARVAIAEQELQNHDLQIANS